MLLAGYPQKPAPESGTFTHAFFSPFAYCFAPNRIIRATAFRLLVEPGRRSQKKPKRSGNLLRVQVKANLKVILPRRRPYRMISGKERIQWAATRNIWPAEFSFLAR